jgi:hypothetical protein
MGLEPTTTTLATWCSTTELHPRLGRPGDRWGGNSHSADYSAVPVRCQPKKAVPDRCGSDVEEQTEVRAAKSRCQRLIGVGIDLEDPVEIRDAERLEDRAADRAEA